MSENKMLLLTLKNFDNNYVNNELEKLIQIADVEEKVEEEEAQLSEPDKNEEEEGLFAAAQIGQLVFNENFKRRIPTTRVMIDKEERLKIKIENQLTDERDPDKNQGEIQEKYKIQNVRVIEDYNKETEMIKVKKRIGFDLKREKLDAYDEESNQITKDYMKNFKYEHHNLRKHIFNDFSRQQEEEENADDNDDSIAGPDSKKHIVHQGTHNSSTHGNDDEKYKPKTYDFQKYRKKDYNELLRKIDRNVQKSNHSFLKTLKETKDRKPNYRELPNTFPILEKTSNLVGKFMSTQNQGDPTPFMEIGDLAHRLLYMDRSMLSATEIEVVSVKPIGREVGPVESLEFCRILLGVQVTVEVFKENKVEQTILGKFMSSVDFFHSGR